MYDATYMYAGDMHWIRNAAVVTFVAITEPVA